MFVLFGTYRDAAGRAVGREAVATFDSEAAAVEYARSVRVDLYAVRPVAVFRPGSVLGSFDDFEVHDLSDLEHNPEA